MKSFVLALVLSGPLVAADELIVASAGTDELLRYDASSGAFLGLLVTAQSGGLQSPGDAMYGLDGHWWLVSESTGEVLKYDRTSGSFSSAFVTAGSGGLGQPGAMISGPANELLLVDRTANRVLHFDGWTGAAVGPFLEDDAATPGIDELGGLSDMRDLGIGPDGRLYVAAGSNASVFRFDLQTRAFVDVFVPSGSGGLADARAIAFTQKRDLLVASYSASSVLRYDRVTGAFLGTFIASGSGGLQNPTALAVDPSGDLVVASEGTNEVLRYDGTTGAFLGVLVSAGSGGLTAPSSLRFTPNRTLKLMGPFGSPGGSMTINAREGTPGQSLFFVYGFAPGNLRVPGCGGLYLDVGNPIVFGSQTSVGSGWASLSLNVPAAASDLTVFLQAIELVTCRTSDVVRRRLASSGGAGHLEIEPGGTLRNGSTYGFGSFTVRNDSWGGQRIARLEIDLREAIFPDLVYDPNGQAGDKAGKDFTVDFDTGTGWTGHTFSGDHDLGWDVLSVDFTSFDPGDNFRFSVDTDPTSIQGASTPGPHETGSISGLELTGAKVRLFFDDGSFLSSRTYRLGTSVTGSSIQLGSAAPAAPALSILGQSNPSIVSNPSQTVRVEGSIGDTVHLLVLEGGLFTAGVPGGGFDLDPFEVNTALAVQELSGTIGTSGSLDFPITLTETEPEGGIHYLLAIVEDASGKRSRPSTTWVIEYQP